MPKAKDYSLCNSGTPSVSGEPPVLLGIDQPGDRRQMVRICGFTCSTSIDGPLSPEAAV